MALSWSAHWEEKNKDPRFRRRCSSLQHCKAGMHLVLKSLCFLIYFSYINECCLPEHWDVNMNNFTENWVSQAGSGRILSIEEGEKPNISCICNLENKIFDIFIIFNYYWFKRSHFQNKNHLQKVTIGYKFLCYLVIRRERGIKYFSENVL